MVYGRHTSVGVKYNSERCVSQRFSWAIPVQVSEKWRVSKRRSEIHICHAATIDGEVSELFFFSFSSETRNAIVDVRRRRRCEMICFEYSGNY